MKNKIELTAQKMFLFVILLIGLGIYCIASGVLGVSENEKHTLNQVFTQSFDKGDLFEGSVEIASPAFLEINHTINFFIPTGKEYYYLILSEDHSAAITIRADKKFGESFDSNWKRTEEVVLKGRIKELPHQAKTRLNEVKDIFVESGLEFHIIKQYYIDTLGGKLYKMRIAVGICILLEVFLFYMVMKKNMLNYQTVSRKIMQIGGIVGLLVILILGVYLMTIK